MHVETVVTQEAWYPFGRGHGIGIHEQREQRLVISATERAALTRVANLAERMRTVLDPLEANDTLRRNDEVRAVALLEVFAREVAEAPYMVAVEVP